jgi:hypothetical protein
VPQPERVIPPVTLAAALAVIGLLVAAPFLIASVISDWRIDAGAEAVNSFAGALQYPVLRRENADVLISSGSLPRIDDATGWPTERSAALSFGTRDRADATPVPADPWRNAYLVNLGARGAVWIVSAGPNGVLETPFESTALAGDDIGARLR